MNKRFTFHLVLFHVFHFKKFATESRNGRV